MVEVESVLLTLSFASGGGPCRQAAVPRWRAGRAVPWRGFRPGSVRFSTSRLRPTTPRAGIRLTASGEQPPAVTDLGELVTVVVPQCGGIPEHGDENGEGATGGG